MIRRAEERDLDSLLDIAKTFIEESTLPVTFDRDVARSYLWWQMHQPFYDVLVDEADDVLAGGVIIGYEAGYYKETCAYVEKLFVHKEFRGIGTARDLVRAVLDASIERGAAIIFAAATAGMGERNEKLYVKLFERHGFTVLGRTLSRTL